MDQETSEALQNIQQLIDGPANIEEAPPYVRGMDLSGIEFKAVSFGSFELEWTVGAHLTHYDGIVQGGVVNVVADTGQSFAFYSTSTNQETYSTSEFTTRFFRPIRAGDVIEVVSTVLNRSRRVCVIETRMTNQETGKLCAAVTGSWMIVDNRELG
jgi:uncharacterized protein (TIGR00369 family)